ncbi:helix-turn-helix domain-containing protein [Clostridium sp. FAM 1755]|uniref:Helix-turn-helix domain-containing protein n=2 Tax=Clostridium TaxID=1485 RepID=A0A6M0T0J2_CLOBO|nr:MULTISPECIES: helix-turn-helix domain-containing protein [Clostridium]EJP6471611.1 helix-turn-helix domain-containing protein [Clostridium botulinum]KOR25549.1 DNA-binding protein [Clostridium sp. L74]MDS1004341.1 helix-turn-helix domain-containing protein [Clostridium sporogenes]NFA60490.1 helix-turn-helix domain-containing protein [Clostridium botulinum]NFI72309.1 helix-turn-helix domain-containing protein [Clostridium sporogenes]
MQLGEKIKYYRKKKGLTIKELSELTNLSIGFISNLERDLNSPSVSNLQQICEILGINLMEILKTTEDKEYTVLKENRNEIFSTDDKKIKFEMLTNGNKHLNAIAITIEGNTDCNDTSWGHNYDELGIVAKGTLEIQMNSQTYTLHEGDSIYVNKFTPHRYKNPCEEINVTYWISVKE